MDNKYDIKPDSPCKRFNRIRPDGTVEFKEKIRYNKKAEAQEVCDKLNKSERAIYQSVPYLCPVCHKWHVGKSKVLITHYGESFNNN